MDQRTSYDKETCPVLTVCGTPDGNFSQERKKDSSAEGTLSVAPVAKENRPYDKGNLIEAAAETECLAAEPQIAAIKGKGVLKSTENSHGDDKTANMGREEFLRKWHPLLFLLIDEQKDRRTARCPRELKLK